MTSDITMTSKIHIWDLISVSSSSNSDIHLGSHFLSVDIPHTYKKKGALDKTIVQGYYTLQIHILHMAALTFLTNSSACSAHLPGTFKRDVSTPAFSSSASLSCNYSQSASDAFQYYITPKLSEDTHLNNNNTHTAMFLKGIKMIVLLSGLVD